MKDNKDQQSVVYRITDANVIPSVFKKPARRKHNVVAAGGESRNSPCPGLLLKIRRSDRILFELLLVFLAACSPSIKPIDIFPEDACAQCKMAFSEQVFASEIIAADGVAYKFDDIGCMDKFKNVKVDIVAAREFYKDYESKQWLASDGAVVIETGIKTPMGSGKVAVRDSSRARALLQQYPKTKALSENSQGCENDCCGGKAN